MVYVKGSVQFKLVRLIFGRVLSVKNYGIGLLFILRVNQTLKENTCKTCQLKSPKPYF